MLSCHLQHTFSSFDPRKLLHIHIPSTGKQYKWKEKANYSFCNPLKLSTSSGKVVVSQCVWHSIAGLPQDNCCFSFSSVAQLCPALCDPMEAPAHQASLSITDSWSLLKLMFIESVMPSNHLILCRPLLLSPSTFPSISVFSNEWALHISWPKYWSFSFSISPSNEHPGLISLGWTGWISLQSKGLSRVFSNTTVQKHQFLQYCKVISFQLIKNKLKKSINSSVLSFLYSPTLTSIHDCWKNHSLD